MTQALSIVTSEHNRVRRTLLMLNGLREQLAGSQQAPDAALFNSIFDYIESYEKMHYPKEEKYLFQALRARNPDSHALLDVLENDHPLGHAVISSLRERLEECLTGAPGARETFLQALAQASDILEKHMAKEEHALFPMALESLTPEDWQVVNEAYLHHDHLLDTLLGETLKAEFDHLHSRIIYYAPEPIGLGLKPPNGEVKTDQALGMSGGLNKQYGHLRALEKLSAEDWQTINEQFIHYEDPRFGAKVKEELRQIHSQIAYYAPAPYGLGMGRTHAMPIPETVDQVLEISALTSHYGRIQALHGIDVMINKGELVALVGSNGAGKTTLLRAIAGLQPASGGSIRFAGQDITRLRPDRRVKLGIALIPEGRQVFGPLSVEDNLLLGAYTRPQDEQITLDLEQIYNLFPILKQKRKEAAGTLSGGQQQMLALGRALMSRPQLLLLDEPSMGLAPLLIEEIFNTIGELRRRGITTFLVEQNASAALAIADRAYVIETGNIALSGSGRELLNNDRVKAAYLGA